MKLTVIGSGTAMADKRRAGPSYLLDADGRKLLFDCGPGSSLGLLKAGVAIGDIDHIFITHPHADHMGNLVPLLLSIVVSGLFYPQTKRSKPLYLHGYPGFKKDYETLRGIMFPEQYETYDILIAEYGDGKKKNFDNFSVSGHEVRHVKFFRAVCFRIECRGKVFMYSGDSSVDDALVKAAKDADLALIEMSDTRNVPFCSREGSSHLAPYESGLIAAQAGVRRLLLVHGYEGIPRAAITKDIRKNYKGALMIARDGMKIDL